MPFITQAKRASVDRDFKLAEDKGDLCYAIYREFIEAFRKERRWTTIHNIYKNKLIDTLWIYKYRVNDKFTHADAIAALHLAWQVFFVKEVLPYEEEKEEENGPI